MTPERNPSWRTSIRRELSQRLSTRTVEGLNLTELIDPRVELSPIDASRISWISDVSILPLPYRQRDAGTQTTWPRDVATQTDFNDSAVNLQPATEHDAAAGEKATASSTKRESSSKTSSDQAEPKYLDGWSLYLVAIALMLTLICSGLDRSIVAVATPAITSEFDSLNDVGWYGSAYLLTLCCFQLPFGKLFAEMNKKYVYLAAVIIFEVGSVICAAASSSVVLIVGRAIAGVGGAGIVSGALIIIGGNIAPARRPTWLGAFGATANVAQAFGPLVGGALVSGTSWRWCFWINLPLGGVSIIMIFLVLRLPPPPAKNGQTWLQLLDNLDALGTSLIMPSIVCLLLALQWGGIEYPWSSWRCILLLILFAILIVAWGYSQYRRGDRATVPIRVVTQRSVAFGATYTTSAFGAIILVLYYVPIWFQAVRGVSAYQSGVNLCALVLPWALMLLVSARLTVYFGYYVPQMLTATVIMSVMAGLMTTYSVGTSTAFWVATLLFFGFGVGLGSQQPIVAAQMVLKGADMALGTSIIVFLQVLSAAIMTSVGQNVLSQRLATAIPYRAPGVDPQVVIQTGVDNLAGTMGAIYSPDQVKGIILAYNDALRATFVVAVVLACLTVIGCAGMEWRNVKKVDEKEKDNAQQQPPAAEKRGPVGSTEHEAAEEGGGVIRSPRPVHSVGNLSVVDELGPPQPGYFHHEMSREFGTQGNVDLETTAPPRIRVTSPLD